MQCLPSVGEKGKFFINAITGGPAEKAGLRKGDQLVWINGAMACELTHSAINKMVGMYKYLFDNIFRICYKKKTWVLQQLIIAVKSDVYR